MTHAGKTSRKHQVSNEMIVFLRVKVTVDIHNCKDFFMMREMCWLVKWDKVKGFQGKSLEVVIGDSLIRKAIKEEVVVG